MAIEFETEKISDNIRIYKFVYDGLVKGKPEVIFTVNGKDVRILVDDINGEEEIYISSLFTPMTIHPLTSTSIAIKVKGDKEKGNDN